MFLVPSIKPVVLERSRWKGVSGSSPERTFSGNLEKKSHFNEATEFLQHLPCPYSLIFPPSSLNSNGTLMWSSPSPPPSIKLKIQKQNLKTNKNPSTQIEIWFTKTLPLHSNSKGSTFVFLTIHHRLYKNNKNTGMLYLSWVWCYMLTSYICICNAYIMVLRQKYLTCFSLFYYKTSSSMCF